jgi:HAD superfamily hydrolase (TIGR01662 family)
MKFFGVTFNKLILTVIAAFLLLRLDFFQASQVILFGWLLAAVFVISKIARYASPKKAVLFDFGGVVADGDYFTQPLSIRKGMPELVNSLKRKNYKVALLTNQNAEVADFLSKRFALDSMFSTQIVSGKVGIKKPDPRIYSHALKRINVKPENAVFVDDKVENLIGANKAGIRGVKFESVPQTAKGIFG